MRCANCGTTNDQGRRVCRWHPLYAVETVRMLVADGRVVLEGACPSPFKQRSSAGIAALEGRIDGARVESRAVFDELRTMHPPCPVARTGLVMATVLDPSLPEVASAAVEARALFEHLEAQVWLDRLDEALARSDAVPPVQASPGHRSAASTASPPVS